MTIALIILAVLILLAVLFLIFHVSKLIEHNRIWMGNYHRAVMDSIVDLQKAIIDKINATIIDVNDARTDVVQLANKVDEGLTHCGNQTRDLKEKINNLDSHLDARLTSPIDKINDTHNRIKTLGKSATSTDELRTVVTEVVSAIVTEAVDVLSRKSPAKTKTVKKTDKDLIKEAKA